MQQDHLYNARLRRGLSLTFIMLATIPLVLISWSSSHFYQESCLGNTTLGLKKAVENRKDVIILFLGQYRRLLTQLISLYPFEILRDQSQLEKIFMAVIDSGIIDIGVLDDNGDQLSYVGPFREKLINKNYAKALWFQEVMSQGSHISDIFPGFRETPHIVVAQMDPLKKFVLRATINSEIFNGLLRGSQIGEKGDAFIVNREGDLQTPSRFGIKSLPPEEHAFLDYHEGTEVRENNDFIYVTSWLAENQWLLFVKMQKGSVLQTFYQARNMDLIMLVITSIFISCAAVLITRFLVNKIEAADLKQAHYRSQMMQVEKMASLGRMAAGVAHEVNNPLQLITDQAGWIKELLTEEDPQAMPNHGEYIQAIEKIKRHVHRASMVTHRLLDFSRKMEAEKGAVAINDLLKESISFLEQEATLHGITFTMHLQEDLPATMTDGPKLQQVILNILHNSLDAIGKDGVIDITTRSDGQTIDIALGDTGPGINGKIIGQIFDPFFTTKGPGKGTGLGLSISYNIIQLLGGRIKAMNRKEGGALFTVTLPIVTLGNSPQPPPFHSLEANSLRDEKWG